MIKNIRFTKKHYIDYKYIYMTDYKEIDVVFINRRVFRTLYIGKVYFTTKMLAATDRLELLCRCPTFGLLAWCNTK